jgi:transcriptional regulator with XRE-family HTH domain
VKLDEGLDAETLAAAIGERLRAFREEHGLSQGDIAERTGIFRGQVCRYEAGKALPSPKYLGVLARLMDVTVDWLLFGEDDPKVVVRDRLLLQRFVAAQDLAPEDRRVILDLLDALMLNAGKDPSREKMG